MSTDITVGIPTYRRPFLLDRALKSVLKQTYKKIFINVSVDYYEKNDQDYKIIRDKYLKFKNIKFYFQKKNIGSLENFFFLSNSCKTEYFMWLADDDEMTSSLIENLKKKIISSKNIVCVCPYWSVRGSNRFRVLERHIRRQTRPPAGPVPPLPILPPAMHPCRQREQSNYKHTL